MLDVTKDRTITLDFPAWRNKKAYLTSINNILALVAKNAISQSPYSCPECLKEAIEGLGDILKPLWEGADLGYRAIGGDELRRLLEAAFEEVPAIMAWNVAKKGVPVKYQFTSRYDTIDPDYDFIDLCALARNVSQDFLMLNAYND